MCGIVAVAGAGDRTREVLLDGLERIEYRGYDSAGLAIADDDLQVRKRAGSVADLAGPADDLPRGGAVGIGHTRWSTHGAPTDANAHPQVDCAGRVAVVHNGIVENAARLRSTLVEAGHSIESEIDTAVIPHLIEDEISAGADAVVAVRAAVRRLDGTFAIAVAIAGSDRVIGVRHGTPLVVGIGDGTTYLASDVPAVRPHTDRVCHLVDGDVVAIGPGSDRVTGLDGRSHERPVETVDWESNATGLGAYDHYMRKEIDEQPRVVRQSLAGRIEDGRVDLDLEVQPDRVALVGAGTSYHAARFGARRFRAAGMPATADIASEFATEPPPIEDALVVAITQSGETADTLAALDAVEADTVAITNGAGSTVTRAADHTLLIRAGPEVSVAATKSFTTSLVTLDLLVRDLTGVETAGPAIDALGDLPEQIESVIDESAAAAVASAIAESAAYIFLGRGLLVPVALEGALKTTELTYEHAEGFPAGEFKHGPLALVSESTPVIAAVTGDGDHARKIVTNIEEIAARGAPIVAVTDGESDIGRVADHVLTIPTAPDGAAAVLATVQLQLLAYHLARDLDRPIDRPRHLAKSVTVE
ncbi:MAG: glutamine--fructose-6-phosphate transaminase (isomerizing) [Halococcoides sp.]